MKKFLLIIGSLYSFCFAASKDIVLVKCPTSKYNASARLKITSPRVLKRNTPVLVQVSNFPIGVNMDSQCLEDNGVKDNKAGSRVLLAFSNGMRVYVSKDNVSPLLSDREYFNKRFRINIPTEIYSHIEDNNFMMYAMLVNSYGETIKNQNAFYTDVYCFGREKEGIRELKKNLKSPFIIYNEPHGTVSGRGVLLDFYVKNAVISPSEYKVDLYVDGNKILRLSRWQPYVIQNLSKGKHNIRLELIDPKGKVIKNTVSVNTSTIYVK